MPYILYIVEFTLAYNMALNLYKFSQLGVGLNLDTPEGAVKSFYILFSTILSSELTIRTMLKLSSAQRMSWQLANRTMIIQSIFVLLNEFVFGSWARNALLQSELPLILVYLGCMVILFLPHIRRYYTPPLVKPPPVREWIPYIIYDFTAREKYRYAFEYEESKEKT